RIDSKPARVVLPAAGKNEPQRHRDTEKRRKIARSNCLSLSHGFIPFFFDFPLRTLRLCAPLNAVPLRGRPGCAGLPASSHGSLSRSAPPAGPAPCGCPPAAGVI